MAVSRLGARSMREHFTLRADEVLGVEGSQAMESAAELIRTIARTSRMPEGAEEHDLPRPA